MLLLHGLACLLCNLGLKEGSWLRYHAEFRGQDHETFTNVGIYIRALYWTMDTASTRGNGDFLGELLPPSSCRPFERIAQAPPRVRVAEAEAYDDYAERAQRESLKKAPPNGHYADMAYRASLKSRN